MTCPESRLDRSRSRSRSRRPHRYPGTWTGRRFRTLAEAVLTRPAARLGLAVLVLCLSTAPSFPQGVVVHPLFSALSNSFLIEGADSLLLVDSGWPGNEKAVLARIAELGKPLRLVLLTHGHADHSGSAAAIRAATGCLVAVHAGDEESLAAGRTIVPLTDFEGTIGKYLLLPLMEAVTRPVGLEADLVLQGDGRLEFPDMAVEFVWTPGHTPGSCCYLVEGNLFTGDLFDSYLALKRQRHYAFDWEEIGRSLRKLPGLEVSGVYSGHGRHVAGQAELLAACPAPTD